MRQLIIFIKNPVKGKVKTRLAAGVGEEEALRIYHQLLDHTREVCTEVDAVRNLYYTWFVDQDDAWPEKDFVKELQPEGDLGEKMSTAFKKVLQNGSPALIIGSDCYQLEAWHIEMAFDQLGSHNFVLGPANDGGYYLLGMNTYHPEVFEDIEWSTEEVLSQTLAKVIRSDRSVFLLPELVDVDTVEDWNQL